MSVTGGIGLRRVNFVYESAQSAVLIILDSVLAIQGSSAHALPAESHGIAQRKTGATEPNARHKLFSAVTR
jgi:hypothetical protein